MTFSILSSALSAGDPLSLSAIVIELFILSHLDYCSGLLCVVANNQLRRLEAVQNAVAPERMTILHQY